MKKENLKEIAINLVKITINEHNLLNLGKEKMSSFIKKNIKKEVNKKEFDLVLHYYCKILAKEGYEIKNNIEKFDIIDYNSTEYEKYRNKE